MVCFVGDARSQSTSGAANSVELEPVAELSPFTRCTLFNSVYSVVSISHPRFHRLLRMRFKLLHCKCIAIAGSRMLGEASTQIRVVKADAKDLVDLSDFIKPFVASGDLLPRTFDELEDLLETSFIARLDGRIVGCAALEIYSKKLCEIRSLAVDPSAQGLGIGKQLVAACSPQVFPNEPRHRGNV